MKPAIEVTGLSKSYVINHKNKASYNTIKDDFGKLIRHPFRKDAAFDKQETFWALHDVSFSVGQGEIFGIVGRNGSGKSTMLKILSRIVEPTKGSAILRGRAASLLEVGTGFNPELTGRENIFFNGSMLGMSRQEIRRKFNDIIEFSEIEKFLDTPVKFYSSGMYVRLAFSVAAHLEPDILILDEVLAVGDASFQRKSLNKILSTMEAGRTVLFVSHSMASVQQLCSRGILLKNGQIEYSGPVEVLTERYTALMKDEDPDSVVDYTWKADRNAPRNNYFNPQHISIRNASGRMLDGPVYPDEDYYFCVEGELKTNSESFNIGYSVKNELTKSNIYLTLSTDTPKDQWPKLRKGTVTFRGLIPKRLLNGGQYRISLISSMHNEHWVYNPEDQTPGVQLIINEKLDVSPQWIGTRTGQVAPLLPWTVEMKR